MKRQMTLSVKIGDGARLPNNDELKLIHEHRKKIPNLSIGDSYWSCENSTEPDFVYGKKGTAYSMTLYSGLFLKGGRGARNQCLVRLVKDKFLITRAIINKKLQHKIL